MRERGEREKEVKKFLAVVFAVVAAAGMATEAAAQAKAAKQKKADKGLAHQAVKYVVKPAAKAGFAVFKAAKKVLD